MQGAHADVQVQCSKSSVYVVQSAHFAVVCVLRWLCGLGCCQFNISSGGICIHAILLLPLHFDLTTWCKDAKLAYLKAYPTSTRCQSIIFNWDKHPPPELHKPLFEFSNIVIFSSPGVCPIGHLFELKWTVYNFTRGRWTLLSNNRWSFEYHLPLVRSSHHAKGIMFSFEYAGTSG